MHGRWSFFARGVAGALAALLVPATTALGAGNRPRPGADEQLIVFARAAATPGAQSRIWIMDGDGRYAAPVTSPPPGATDSSPTVGHFYPQVFFQRMAGGVSQIYTASAQRGFGVPLSQYPGGRLTAFGGAGAVEPTASPTEPSGAGDVAFTVLNGDGTCDVWVMQPDGSHERRLTDHGGADGGCDFSPTWSPDGRSIAFTRTTGNPAQPTSLARLVVAERGGTPAPFGLGPDPVAAFSWRMPGPLLLLPASGRTPTAVATFAGNRVRVLRREPGLEGAPAWSADGRYAAVSRRGADGSTDIVTIGLDGRLKDITSTPGVDESEPAWELPGIGFAGGGPGPSVRARSAPARRRGFRRRRGGRKLQKQRSTSFLGRVALRRLRFGVQRLPSAEVSFGVMGGRVRDFTIPWAAACRSLNQQRPEPPVIDTTQIQTPLRLRGGRFSVVAPYDMAPGPAQVAAVSIVVSGRIRGRRASGTIQAYAELAYPARGISLYSGVPLDECQMSRPVRWTARAGG